MTDLSDKTVLVACHALFISHAQRLARDFGRVLLYCPWETPTNPTMHVGMVGTGLEGVERVESIFGPHIEDVDLFYFPDVGFADVALYLESQGKRVWGGRRGEELENFRDLAKEEMERLGLPVQPWKKLVGMDALRGHLKGHQDQYVKLNRWRGHFESFKADSYDMAEAKLNQIEHEMGPFSKVAEFMCEDEIPDAVEVGIDTFCIDGEFPSHTIVGIEVKDLGYVGQFVPWDSIPDPVRRWHEAMGPTLKKYGYRGWLSNEVRIGKDLEPYMIDATCRAPSPPSELFQEQYANFSEIIWEGSDGVMDEPEAAAEWGAQVILSSGWLDENFLPVEFDPKFSEQIKFYNPVVIEGRHYIVPQPDKMEEFGSVIGLGKSLEAAVDSLKRAADTVKAYNLHVPDGSIDKAMEQIRELESFGLKLFALEKEPATA